MTPIGPPNSLSRHRDLVFDVGMNDGEDTGYYLAKGYRVVGVEADPRLCRQARTRFADAIGDGRLVVVCAAVSDQQGPREFFVNLSNPHWSSLERSWAAKPGTEVRSLSVPGVGLGELLAQHGVPHYMKVDIEGADLIALRQLASVATRPSYVSVEDCRFGYDYIQELQELGYTRFQLSNQFAVGGSVDAEIGHTFTLGASGPFGSGLQGDWMDVESFLLHYEVTVRDRLTRQRRSPPSVWWDIHAALEPEIAE